MDQTQTVDMSQIFRYLVGLGGTGVIMALGLEMQIRDRYKFIDSQAGSQDLEGIMGVGVCVWLGGGGYGMD